VPFVCTYAQFDRSDKYAQMHTSSAAVSNEAALCDCRCGLAGAECVHLILHLFRGRLQHWRTAGSGLTERRQVLLLIEIVILGIGESGHRGSDERSRPSMCLGTLFG